MTLSQETCLKYSSCLESKVGLLAYVRMKVKSTLQKWCVDFFNSVSELGALNYEQFDRILEIAKKYDVVLSIGDAIRPGCLADSLDRA